MSKTMNISVTLNAVIKINEGVSLEDFLFRGTEWMGEPRDSSGCVIALNPVRFNVLGKDVEVTEIMQTELLNNPKPEPEPLKSPLPIVIGARKKPYGKILKEPNKIKKSLMKGEGLYFVVNYPGKSLKLSVPFGELAGKIVSYIDGPDTVTMEAGDANGRA